MSGSRNQIKAIPTEYKGIVFRSKSEAIFARSMDLSGVAWEYEPQFLAVGDWVPDFFVSEQLYNNGIPYVGLYVIEFKPSMPTSTYKRQLAENYGQMLWTPNTLRLLIVGNAYSPESNGIFQYKGDKEWIELNESWWEPFLGKLEEARKYRFDLKEPETQKIEEPRKAYDWDSLMELSESEVIIERILRECCVLWNNEEMELTCDPGFDKRLTERDKNNVIDWIKSVWWNPSVKVTFKDTEEVVDELTRKFNATLAE